jgi:phage shock protein PspC (stress-responsive transcriptional regulator)
MKSVLNDRRFFRDAAKAKIAGVCAGLAKHLDINPWLVRAGAVVCFVLLPVATALAYVLAILLLRYR